MPSVLIVVWVRARLLARSAASIRPVMAGPAVPAAVAARAASLIWATIWSSPTAIESSPHATENKCSIAVPPTRMRAVRSTYDGRIALNLPVLPGQLVKAGDERRFGTDQAAEFVGDRAGHLARPPAAGY
jgi:hypothetical protein